MKNEENAGQTPSESQQSELSESLKPLLLEFEQYLQEKQPTRQEAMDELIRMVIRDQMVLPMAKMLEPLVVAMAGQTEAITRLAMSNEALVEAMEQDDPDPDALPDTYMDGSKVL